MARRRKLHKMTSARRAALRKAQLASARKRRKKASKTNTTISRSGGTTYKTTYTRRIIGGHSVETTAYRRGEFRGVARSFHTKKGAEIYDIYVSKSSRGKGVSRGLANRQIAHAKKRGLKVTVTGNRTDGGEKFVQRNLAGKKGVTIKPRKRGDSKSMTENMDFWVGAQARGHAVKYKKTQTKNLSKARKVRYRNIKKKR